MKTQQRRWFIFAVLLLMAATLSCGLLGGEDEAPESAAPAQPAESSPGAESESPPPEPQTSDSQANLGEEYRSEMGGFAFQGIPNYTVEEAFGFAGMTAPDADSETGPTFLLMGGVTDEAVTTDQFFTKLMEDAEGEDVTILERREITVDGKPGILAEIAGTDNGQPIRMRVAIVVVSDNQQFTMIATAPEERWDEIAANFDAVLASVYFFEPQDMSLDALGEMLEETPEAAPENDDASNAGEYNFSDLEELSNFPSQYSDLPPGGFAILLVDTTGTMALVNGEQAQPQPGGDEYEIILPDDVNAENSITLYLPLNIAPGILTMTSYAPDASPRAPGAVIQLGSALYSNNDGIIMVEAMDGNTISGSIFFVATDDNGAELSVSGFFNQLPLSP